MEHLLMYQKTLSFVTKPHLSFISVIINIRLNIDTDGFQKCISSVAFLSFTICEAFANITFATRTGDRNVYSHLFGDRMKMAEANELQTTCRHIYYKHKKGGTVKCSRNRQTSSYHSRS